MTIKKPSKKQVQELFSRYNTEHFGGVLPAIPVHWARMLSYGEWCDTTHLDSTKYPHGVIFLSMMEQPACGWEGMLLHEMIHALLYFSQRETEVLNESLGEAHDERFARECNRIGAKLGIEPVTVGECWSWPWTAHDPDDLDDHHE